MVVPVERVRIAEDAAREIAALEARRERLVDALEEGSLTRANVQTRLEAIADYASISLTNSASSGLSKDAPTPCRKQWRPPSAASAPKMKCCANFMRASRGPSWK